MKNNKTPLPSYVPPEEEKKKLLKNWQTAVKTNGEALKETHVQKEYSFSTPELRQMIKLFTIQTIAKQTQDDKLNSDVLPRLGIVPSPDVKILFDLTIGRLSVWTPREKKIQEEK